ncbi:MAG: HNH endonuclease [Oscillospiraceae bacterium]|jgi:hypothetical protein|nr:HNH endonuclease [Oscillospiraceae bacterium]
MARKKPIAYEVDEKGCWICTSHTADTCGYPKIFNSGKRIHVSRYIYEQKNGSIPANMVVRHKCDNRMCINPDHLEIGSQYENVHDMITRGRQRFSQVGERNPKAKLSENDVAKIQKLLASGERQVDIARKYGVTRYCVYSIARCRIWKQRKIEAQK